DMVELLLGAGADPNAQSIVIRDVNQMPFEVRKWDTPLLAAGSAPTAAILLRRGADPNRLKWDGTSPLMIAAQDGGRAWCRALLAHGAASSPKDAEGLTAADLARKYGHPEVAAMIEVWPRTR